jgi:cellulose synthase/poly-beta-1,6-N-acetylglucosamine synthase-like glycosyltransferase
MDTIILLLTVCAGVLLAYTYAGYPIVLWLLSTRTAPVRTSDESPHRWPTVSVIISAHNEAAVIGRRIKNILDQDYPADCIQIVVGSDGSSDGTGDYLLRHRFPRTRACVFEQRRGKASVLNDLVSQATGEFLIFSDAATVFYPDAIKQLVRGFWRHPSAAVVGGTLEIRSSDRAKNLDGLYWRYEMFLKTHESRTGAGLGVSGAIYAVRRADYQPLPRETMADDLLEPLLIRLRTAGDVVLDASARAWQVTPKRMADEFHRRVRTGAGILHALIQAWPLLSARWGKAALALWSHKLLRLFGPWFLMVSLLGSLWLSDRPLFRALVVAQGGIYLLGLVSGVVRPIPLVGKVTMAVRYFLVLNAALGVGVLQFLSGRAQPAWRRTVRPVETMDGLAMLNQKHEAVGHEQRPAA